MNHIYRLVRSRVTGLMIAVSELTKTPGGNSSRVRRVPSSVLATALLSASFVTAVSFASPTGGSVVAGNASITSGPDAVNTTINQTSQSAIINWQSFDIASHESVQFVQPNASSIALNRVLGADATHIMGNLSSNGKIFLINPNGVLFARGAQVNVGGLIASTRNITDDDFLSGRFYFSGSSDATVANYGSITADGGYVALLGAHVNNQGLISARLGSIALASGEALTLDTAGDGLLNVTVNAGAIRSLVDNGGLLRADGGQVVMTARSASALVQSVVNNTGVVQAQTIENHNGVIKLLGDMESGVVNVGGQLDASAPENGDGGFIDTSAAHVVIAPDTQVTTLAANGATGNWLIDPVDFTIAASGGDMTGAQLTTSLAGSNITILSGSGGTGVNGDISVYDTIAWSANRLTLSAYNNININTAMMGSGTGSLALLYGQGAVAAGNTSTVNVNAPVNLAAGNNFSTQLGSNGGVINYTVITSLGAAGSTTATDLQGISGNLAGNYVLGANIDASATSGWNAGAGFVPIGTDPSRFAGTFDGLGHTVSNIYINRTGANFTGLFGYTGAGSTVRNVGLIGGSVTSNQWGTGSLVGSLAGTLFNSYATTNVTGFQTAGGLVGVIDGGLIDRSYASGTVYSGGNGEVGGLVGLSWGPGGGTTRNSYATGNVSSSVGNVGGLMGINWGTIVNSYATGTATGSVNYVGGLVGNNSNGSVTGSYASGAVSGSNYVGGLVGNNSNSITSSYATGSVSGSDRVGGLAGSNNGTLSATLAMGAVTGTTNVGGLIGSNSFGSISNSYWNTTTTGQASSAAGTGLTTAQLQASLPTGFSSSTWGNASNRTTPYLLGNVGPVLLASDASATYYNVVSTLTQLQNIYSRPTLNYVLVNDIDASATSLWNAGQGFTPIGNGSQFTGIFDGLGHVVNGLYINRPGSSSLGLFGTTSGATFRNVGVTNGTITGASYLGLLVGNSASGTFANVYSTGTVSGVSWVGGLVGLGNGTTMTNSYSTANVTGTSQLVGGLFGQARFFGTITNSYATGNVTGGSASYVGGLIGQARYVTLTNTYATGNVTAGFGGGGLVGLLDGATINTSYSSGAVSGSGVGGLVGTLSQTTAVNNSYWNTTTSGQATSSGGTGLTTAQMRSTASFTGFDLTNSWIVYEGYTAPLLRSFMTSLNVTANDATKTYDGQAYNGSAGVTYSSVPNMSNLFGTVSVTGGTNAGTSATVASGLYSNQQGYAINYVNGTLTVNRATLTATARATNRAYDGTTTANATLGSFTGLIGTETIGATATATFNTKDVATANLVTVTGVTLADGTNGGLASNYTLASGQTANANITQRALTATASATDKVYDGTTTASATLGSVTGLIGTETIGASATAAFNTKDVATANLVTVNSVVLADGTNGGLASNYSLASGQTASASITPVTLTATASATNKVYDGTTTASATMTGLTGFVGTETVTATGTASFNTKDVATANLVTVSSVNLSDGTNGGIASNYSLASGQTTSASITQRTLTAAATAIDKVYDGTTTASATLGSISGLIGTETIGATATAAFNTKDVATANLVTVTGVNLTNGTNGGLASNYSLAGGQTDSANITPVTLTAAASATDKVYDGTTTASATLTGLSGFVGSETVTASGAASFNTKDVATANQVTVNSVVLANGTNGGIASNYSLASGQTASANITQRGLTATASATDKVYDGTTTASATLNSLTGLVGTETVNAAAAATFNTKDVATANLVTVNGVTLSDGTNGGLASNYSLASGQTANASITQRALTATASTTGKVYDGTNNASATLGSITGLIGAETVAATATATFNTKDVATANVVTVNTATIADGTNGGLASNYSLASGQTASANISQRALTATASATNRVYDGTTVASATLDSLAGMIGTETINTSTTAAFNTKDVATANLVTVSGVTLSDGANGGLASNYSLASGQTASANITQRALTATVSANDKVYDGTTNANATLDSLTGLVGSETINASAAASFNTKDVSTANLVTVGGVTLSDGANGGVASNYSLATGQTASANITQRALAATASATDKVYDGTTTASVTLGLTGMIGTETINTSTTAAFNTKDVATANLVTVGGIALSDGANGGLASNYSLTNGQTATASITQRTLTATASATGKVYDGTMTASATLGSLTGLVGAETISTSTTASFNTKDVATANLVTVNTATLSDGTNGGLASNYSLASGQTASANITQRTLTATASATGKVYDGTTTASATLGSISGLIGAETLGATAIASFNTKDVATANLVTVNTATLSDGANGGLASNYSLASGQTASANITPRSLSATAAAATRVYDGTTNAAATMNGLTGFVGSETVIANVTGQFNSKDVATANLVTIDGVTLSNGANGGLASNYSLVTGQTAAATITQRALTVAGASVLDRVYDGTVTATVTGGALVGVIGGENVSLNRSGSFATPFAGQQIPVASSSVLNGADAANYTLIQPSGLSASILPVIDAATLPNGVSPAAAYESARVTSTGNVSTISPTDVSAPIATTMPSASLASSSNATARVSGLNLTIIGTGLNAPAWSVSDPEDAKK